MPLVLLLVQKMFLSKHISCHNLASKGRTVQLASMQALLSTAANTADQPAGGCIPCQLIGASLGSAAPLLLLPLAIKRERIKHDVPPSNQDLRMHYSS
jgi:hypothetical protein